MVQPGGTDGYHCPRCGAPVGSGGGRCPFCGTEMPQVLPSQRPLAAPVGLSEAAQLRPGRSRPPAPKPKGLSGGALWAIAGGVAVVVLLSAAVLATRLRKDAPATGSSVEPPVAPATTAFHLIHDVPVADPTRVDPEALLVAARRRVREWDPEPGLIDVAIAGARDGIVDVTSPGNQVAIRFAVDRRDPKSPGARDRVQLVFSEPFPPPQRTPAGAADKPVGDPTCVWTAAWRAFAATGVPAASVVDARYATSARSGTPTWAFTVRDRTDLAREIDGTTCAIKAR